MHRIVASGKGIVGVPVPLVSMTFMPASGMVMKHAIGTVRMPAMRMPVSALDHLAPHVHAMPGKHVQTWAKQRKNAVKGSQSSGGQAMRESCHSRRLRRNVSQKEIVSAHILRHAPTSEQEIYG
jgi:hypothetical protein